MNEMRKLMETIKRLDETYVKILDNSHPSIRRAINTGALTLDEEYGDVLINDYNDLNVKKAIHNNALEIDIEFMEDDEIRSLYHAGIKTAKDANLGVIDLGEYV